MLLIGRAAPSVIAWLDLAKIEAGPPFRPIDRQGRLGTLALDRGLQPYPEGAHTGSRRLDPLCF